MCGICGKFIFDEQAIVPRESIERMMQAVHYRGPDGRGSYLSGPVGLGHTRLAIIDLSTGGQPLSNEDGTVWIVFNGEIYNFLQLRDELLAQGHVFRTHSDTEVIVHLYEQYGVQSLTRLQGMFAFAIWDGRKQCLFIARDRIGIKPLYYANTGRSLVFGSEIKALLVDPEVKCQVELQSVDEFLTHFCLPGKSTLWKGIFKLEPGYCLVATKDQVKREQYWDLQFKSTRRWASLDEAADAVYQITRQKVREHMISDVPVGCLLSGGLDSTVVLSCATAETGKRISTFTVGFEDPHFEDERRYARMAAASFGSDHHEITFSAQEFWDYLPSLVRHMEEPVCDPPAVALHYVSKLARNHVTVLLSGEGGDEAFGGYYAYRNLQMLEQAKACMGPLRGPVAGLMAAAGRLPGFHRLGRLAPQVSANLADYHYSRVTSAFSYFNQNKEQFYSPGFYAATSRDASLAYTRDLFRRVRNEPTLNQLLYLDTKTSLPDDLLIKADRITMANSLELRVPFLDHALLEFTAGLPVSYKVRGRTTKRVLRQAFSKHIPREIIERKKAGFPVPIDRWLCNDLRSNVYEVLTSKKCLERGYFKRDAVEYLFKLADQRQSVTKEIFSLLTLELLHAEFVDAPLDKIQ